jgi:hypothetical protein
MTNDSGHMVLDSRADEVAQYAEEVRAALGNLPASERDELLEDLPAHLSEVAAEDPAPLVDRLGPPAAYAAELRAALHPAESGRRRRTGMFQWADRWQRTRAWLGRVDRRVGPLLGYERASEFTRLLIPAWWVLRGYLAAMFVVILLDNRPPAAGEIGLIPRLGGSTLAGWIILAGFVAGSVWFARRYPRLGRWPRRVVFAASAYLVVFGISIFATVDENEQWGWPGPNTDYVSVNPYEGVQDVFPVDQDGRLLTDVALLDQDGNPLDIGWDYCGGEFERLPGEPVAYPRCPDEMPWWMPAPSEGSEPQE